MSERLSSWQEREKQPISVYFFPGLFVPETHALCSAVSQVFSDHQLNIIPIAPSTRSWEEIVRTIDHAIENARSSDSPVILGAHSVAASILASRIMALDLLDHPNIVGLFLINPDPDPRQTARESPLLRRWLSRAGHDGKELDEFLSSFPETLGNEIIEKFPKTIRHTKTITIIGDDDALLRSRSEFTQASNLHVLSNFGHTGGNLEGVREALFSLI